MKKAKLFILPLLIFAIVLSCTTPVFAALRGDVDCDGNVSAADARIVLRASVGLEVHTAELLQYGDVDGTPGISASDARLILRASVGLEELGEINSGEHEHNYKVTETLYEATCTGRGRVELTCSCGDSKKEYIPSLGHNYVLKETIAPSCTVKGKEISECTRCYRTDTEYTDKIAHSYTVVVSKQDATCTKIGHIQLKCATCSLQQRNKLEMIPHDYDKKGICTMCGNSDSGYYEEIPEGGKWIVEDNWEISIESVRNHSLDSSSINASQGYTNQQCAMITYKVKNIGFKSHHENATNGLSVSPLKFNVYDETGEQANNYVCKHTKYPAVELKGLSDTGTVPVVLMNNSTKITFVINLTDSNGVIRRAFFTAPVTN